MPRSRLNYTIKKQKILNIERADVASIKCMEKFLKVPESSSLFSGKQEVLQKALVFSTLQSFGKREDGKPWKIFSEENFIYYCITYNDYHVIDIITGEEIASAELENDWLKNICVNIPYRRKGIGTNLIKAIVKTIGSKFLIPAKGLPSSHAYYLSSEGAQLINSCIQKKIISDEQCMMEVPPASRTNSLKS